MKIKLDTKAGLQEFEGELTLLTYDIYFSTFGSDLLIDAQRSVEVMGMYSRAYLLRVIYSMIKTVDTNLLDFLLFLEMLEDDVITFFENIDDELIELLTSKITARADKELTNHDEVIN